MPLKHVIPAAAPALALSTALASGAAAQAGSCADTLAADLELSRAVSAFRRTGVLDTLRGPGSFTVFAPTDRAIARDPSDLSERLSPRTGSDQGGPDIDPVAAAAAMNSHVVEGRHAAAELRPGVRLKTRNGTAIEVVAAGGSQTALRTGLAAPTIGTEPAGARIVQADTACSNGVVHKIDGVLAR